MHPSLYSSYREKFVENDRAKTCLKLIDGFNECVRVKTENGSNELSRCSEIVDKYIVNCTIENKETLDKK